LAKQCGGSAKRPTKETQSVWPTLAKCTQEDGDFLRTAKLHDNGWRNPLPPDMKPQSSTFNQALVHYAGGNYL
jgi:hypothetical protein